MIILRNCTGHTYPVMLVQDILSMGNPKSSTESSAP